MAIFAMIIGNPIRREGIKKPYATNKIHPDMLTIRNHLMRFIVNEISTINEAK